MLGFLNRTYESAGTAEEYRLSYCIGAMSSASPGQPHGIDSVTPAEAASLICDLQRYCDYYGGQRRDADVIAAVQKFGRELTQAQAKAFVDALHARAQRHHAHHQLLGPERLCERLQLAGDADFPELSLAIAHMSRHQARLLLDELDRLAEYTTGVRDWDVTRRVATLSHCITTARTPYRLGAGCLHLLCARAGEPMLLDVHGSSRLLDDVSPEGARRLLRRLHYVRRECRRTVPDQRAVLFFNTMGYDSDRRSGSGDIERRLHDIALQNALPLSEFDVMSPATAWRELAHRLNRSWLANRFLEYQAGEGLTNAFVATRAYVDDCSKRLFVAAGLTAYLMPTRHPLRSVMSVIGSADEHITLAA